MRIPLFRPPKCHSNAFLTLLQFFTEFVFAKLILCYQVTHRTPCHADQEGI